MKLLAIVLLVRCFCVHALQNPYCNLPCDFGNGHSYLHTVCERGTEKCGPSLNCGADFKEIKLTNILRQYLLDLHNNLRNKVASGSEKRNLQPPAKKMMVLKYNKELEFIAQCWANTCNGNPLKHDTCRRTKQEEHVGQNLGFINSTHPAVNLKEILHQLVMYWYDEVAAFKSEWVSYTNDRGPDVKVGHYTQMIWADTDSVGCALSYYTTPNKLSDVSEKPKRIYTPGIGDVIILPANVNKKWHHYVLVCNYSPGGNYIGEPVYDSGNSCSGCPKSEPCLQYPALCGKQTNVKKTNQNYTSYTTLFAF